MSRTLLPILVAAAAVLFLSSAAHAQEQQCPALSYAPGLNTPGTVLFEDLWPSNGDLDFNDAVVTYNYIFSYDDSNNVAAMEVTINILAAGADLNDAIYLHLPLPASTVVTLNQPDGNGGAVTSPATTFADATANGDELVIEVINNTHSLFSGGGFINTDPSLPVQTPSTAFSYTMAFDPAIDLGQNVPPYDLFMARSGDFTHQIHLPQFSGTPQMDTSLFDNPLYDDLSNEAPINLNRWFVNASGLPFALNIPGPFQWPQEKVMLSDVYSDISDFASSGGASSKDWYDEPPSGAVFSGGPAPIFVPQTVTPFSRDSSCTPIPSCNAGGECNTDTDCDNGHYCQANCAADGSGICLPISTDSCASGPVCDPHNVRQVHR